MNIERLIWLLMIFQCYVCNNRKYTTDEEDYTTIESIDFIFRFNRTIGKLQTILMGLTYENINYQFQIKENQPMFILTQVNQSDLVLTLNNQLNDNQWYRFYIERNDRTLKIVFNNSEQSTIEIPESRTNIFIGAELIPSANDDIQIANITVTNVNRSVQLHEDEESTIISSNSTQTIAFLPNDNNEIVFPSPIKSFFETLSFSFRTYSNSSILIQFEDINLSINTHGYLVLNIPDRQTQLIDSPQSITNQQWHFIRFEFVNRTLHVSIDKHRKTSVELVSSYLIIENFVFGPENHFYGCIENFTYNQQIFSFEHLPLTRQQCSFKEPSIFPLIIELNPIEQLTQFSFRLITNQTNAFICEFIDENQNSLRLIRQNQQFLLIYLNQSIDFIINSNENQHEILIENPIDNFTPTKLILGQSNFVGCMQDFLFNNKSFSSLEHTDQLDRLTNTCQITTHKPKSYSNLNMPLNVRFSVENSDDIVQVDLPSNEPFESIELTIKTRSISGIIFVLNSLEQQYSFILSLKHSRLQLNEYFHLNQSQNLLFNQTIHYDYEYHILISNRISKTMISLNYIQIQVSSRIAFDSLTLGGGNPSQIFSYNQFIGCFSNITYNSNACIPEGSVKSDRYDCFYHGNTLCKRVKPCREEFCGESDCSLVCVPSIGSTNPSSLFQYQSQLKSSQYEEIYLTIFTTSGNSSLFMTTNGTFQVSIILQDFNPRLIIQNGGIIYTYDFPGRIRGDQWHTLQCQKSFNRLDLTFDDETRHYTNLSENFSLFANEKIHVCGEDFIGYVQDILLISDHHHENLIQNSISNPGLIDYDQSVTWNNRADIPQRTPCERIQCLNGGYCIQPATPKALAYCHCPSQYTGYRCEQTAVVVVDPCSTYQCGHGTCQKDRSNQVYCSCYEGYGGSRCETQIDPCAKVNCNYGRCEVDRSRPVCRCFQGYTGHECRTSTDACARVSCNYGTCINEGTSYRCECQRGYEGAACDRPIDPCSSFVCYNGGVCYTQEYNQPVCQCAPGYRGTNCYEIDVDPCTRYDCYGGTCTNDRGVARCICPTGRAGPRCQDDICVLYPCANNGQCVPEASTRRCICSSPYYGDDCRDVYRPNPCDNIYCGYGQCREGICECHDGYSGSRCDIAPDRCAGINCNYGLCEEGRCSCQTGYVGFYCDTPTTTVPPVPLIVQTPRPVLTPHTVGPIGPKKGQLIDYGRLVSGRAGPIGWILPLLAGLLLIPLALCFAVRKCATGGCLPARTRGYVPVVAGDAGNRATRDLELVDQRGDALTASSGGFQTERIEQTREVVREYGAVDSTGGVFTSYPTMSSGQGDLARDNQQQSSSNYSQQHIIETDYHVPPVADFGYSRGGAVTEGYRDTFESWETSGGGAYSMNAMFADGGLQTDYELSNINSVSMTPNGKYAIVGQSQGPPQIWDAVNGQLVSSMQGISSNCSKVALACSGTLLVGLTSDGIDAQPSILQIWDVNTGKPVQLTHQIKCATFTLSNNSNSLVMAGNQKYGRGISVGILDLNNSELTKEIKSDTNQSYGNTPSFITLTPDERYAIVGCSAGSTTNYVVFDLTTPHEIIQPPLITLDADPKISLLLNNDQMLTGTRNGQVILWDIPSCQRILSLNDNGQSAHRDRVTDLKISPDRSFFLTTSADGTAKIWDTNSKELISRLTGHKREITCGCVSTNQLVATGSKDQTICLWRATTGQLASTMPVAMAPLDIHMAAHNRTIVAIGDKDGERQLLMLRVVSIQR